jgi:Zn-dependent protease
MLGRLTLNPVKHVDPIGTIVMPLIAFFTHIPVIGWARPVPVNTYNLRDPKLDHAFIALAGPVSNLTQAAIFTGFLWLIEPFSGGLVNLIVRGASGPIYWLWMLLYMICISGIIVNLLLAIFNLIPIPPLDGGWILGGVLPESFSAILLSIGQFGFIIIWFLLYAGFFSYILYPIMNSYLGFFLPGNGAVIVGYIFSLVF